MRPVASPLFQGLSAEEWAALEQSGCLRTKSYPRHAVIFHAGEQVHALGVVLRGTVHIENLDLWGSKSILSSISAGQAFAETYALCGDVMMVDAVAAEECEVLFVNISAFSGGAPGTVHEKLLRNLLTVSMRKNLSLSQRIFCTTPKTVRGRLLTYFSAQAARKKGRLSKAEPVKTRSTRRIVRPGGCFLRLREVHSGSSFRAKRFFSKVSRPSSRILHSSLERALRSRLR